MKATVPETAATDKDGAEFAHLYCHIYSYNFSYHSAIKLSPQKTNNLTNLLET